MGLMGLVPFLSGGVGAIVGLSQESGWTQSQEIAGPSMLGCFGAIVGLPSTRGSRRQERRGDQASYEWLDELFPLPDLGVTGLDPVFGVPVNQDH